ncbi:hypothetical protein SLNSH_01420 [Alsobacter soli]|uniref:Uncharacterized protein n=1 Tax=Alsobacter soli TaxID=2109933 RepID=A0A2T1HZF4_9HYPH|nr:hypothetical protein [Alsobacter soli]PSC07061.1 hypothetical protein SLNSH_01420 [Alsobacter soli]
MFAYTADGSTASVFRSVLRRSALALVASVALGGSAFAGPQAMLPPPPSDLVKPTQWFGEDSGSSEIADILYSRYGMQRVMRIRATGDLYRADAIDRRGYRVRVTLDGRGRMLDSFVVGSRAYDAPVPLPPRGVPGGERYRYVDPQDGTELPPPGYGRYEQRSYEQRSYGAPSYDQRYARTPESRSFEPDGVNPAPDTLSRERPSTRAPKSRQARNPDAATAPAAPRKPKAVPSLPKTEHAAPAKPAPEKPAETAARPAAPEPEATKPVTPAPMPAPAPTAVPPTTTPPVVAPEKPAAQEPPAVRQAAPAPQRIPEPLVDPKTGQPTGSASGGGSVPAAPLDDSSKKADTPMVPPATLE